MSLLIHRPWVRQGISSLEEFFVDRFRECFIKDLQVLTHSVRMGTNALTYRTVWVVRSWPLSTELVDDAPEEDDDEDEEDEDDDCELLWLDLEDFVPLDWEELSGIRLSNHSNSRTGGRSLRDNGVWTYLLAEPFVAAVEEWWAMVKGLEQDEPETSGRRKMESGPSPGAENAQKTDEADEGGASCLAKVKFGSASTPEDPGRRQGAGGTGTRNTPASHPGTAGPEASPVVTLVPCVSCRRLQTAIQMMQGNNALDLRDRITSAGFSPRGCVQRAVPALPDISGSDLSALPTLRFAVNFCTGSNWGPSRAASLSLLRHLGGRSANAACRQRGDGRWPHASVESEQEPILVAVKPQGTWRAGVALVSNPPTCEHTGSICTAV
ncbi:hypothetical protein OIDMADRAFT_143178 [Oidiodendron maius Zn]|uniref:Uncharacterized protein n=1 Tax=Oidiodendron maius (strain Zn) TaxID=913774 RepID=A0A0C3HKV4_OIDMZ|nr:hypothetical protein OIDMADRAFT_143178 [Oidiodendron maius Zn]